MVGGGGMTLVGLVRLSALKRFPLGRERPLEVGGYQPLLIEWKAAEGRPVLFLGVFLNGLLCRESLLAFCRPILDSTAICD